MLPILPLVVAACIHETFELPIGDLVAVDPEIADSTRRYDSGIGAALNANHAARNVRVRYETDDEINPVGEPRGRSNHQGGVETRLGELDAEDVSGDPHTVNRRTPNEPPIRIGPSVRLDRDIGAGGLAANGESPRDFRP